MKKKICFMLLFINCMAYSQLTYKEPLVESIHSPNATELGKYGDIPVSFYTGETNISIPIYQINEGGIPLDINMQYNSSGVLVNSVPGWVGQNWSLNAGGIITRSVKGFRADEFDITKGENLNTVTENYAIHFNWLTGTGSQGYWPWAIQGYKNASNVLNNTIWDSASNLSTINSNSNYAATSGQNGESAKLLYPDLEPDIFTFNFMGHTGKFFLGQDGQWKVQSSSNLKVICSFPNDLIMPLSTPPNSGTGATYHEFPRIINTITLLDEDGNKFYFGGPGATELTFPNFVNQHDTPVVSSAWYLAYVTDKFGNIIYRFDYERQYYAAHFYLNYGVINGFPESENYSPTISPDNTNNCDSRTIKGVGQLILPVYLKKITMPRSGSIIEFNSSISNAMKFKQDDNPLFPLNSLYNTTNDMLNFEPLYFSGRLSDFTTLNPEANNGYPSNDVALSSLKWKKLDNIVVKDKSSSQVYNFTFDYENQPDRRLFLKSMVLNTDKKYSFEYYYNNLLPNFMSSAIDHLGYYNGHRFNFTCSSYAYTFWRNYKTERETHPDYVKYGSLTKITYPTGGVSEFEFEPHTYSKAIDKNGTLLSVASDGIIGGLRIKKITNKDGKGNSYIKEYLYKNDISATRSSGNLLFSPTYFVEGIHYNGTSAAEVCKEININPTIRLTNLSGNTIEYETVIEKETNSVNATNSIGYTIYKYSNYSQFPDLPANCSIPDNKFKYPRTDKGIERGKLLEKSIYDNTNILKAKNTYLYQANQNLKVNAIAGKYRGGSVYELSPYQIFYTDKYLTDEKEEIFSSSGSTSKIKKHTYKRYPDVSGTIINGGDLYKNTDYELYNVSGGIASGILTTYKYPFDYTDAINTNMYNNRIIPSIYEKNELITGDPSEPNDSTILSEQQTVYTEISGWYDIIQVPQSVLYKKGNSSFETKFRYLKYSYDGNLQEYKIENGAPNCIIWGYNETKPIAKIENATYASITLSLITAAQTASNTGTEADLLIALTNLRNALPSAMVTTYTYIPLVGVSTITDSKGDKNTYAYDSSGRLRFVKDAQGNLLSENQYHYKN
ncbi:hypothetical protein ASE21_08680 [Flavobacterium sp. Root901]|nr:hypothetical protein ASE21_08680 [Flavobacterium sp. Root901]